MNLYNIIINLHTIENIHHYNIFIQYEDNTINKYSFIELLLKIHIGDLEERNITYFSIDKDRKKIIIK